MANQIIKSATESRLIIIDKKRAKDIFDTIGIQPSEVSRILDSNGSIPQSYEKSNTPDEKKSKDDTIVILWVLKDQQKSNRLFIYEKKKSPSHYQEDRVPITRETW